MDKVKNITIGVPCFNEEKNVLEMYEETKKVIDKIKNYKFNFLFVDNGSLDKTREKISFLVEKEKNVRGIFLSRNFGPEASGQAVMDFSRNESDALIMLPCDLQDPPSLIPKLIERWEHKYDLVLAQYKKTEDSRFIAFCRKSFYSLFKKISNIDVPINVSGFGLMDKKILTAINSLPEKFRFGRGLSIWVGFKKTFITYERASRKRGKSSFSIFDYIKLAERGVFGFSYLPLDIMVYLGFIITVLSFLFIIIYLIATFIFGDPIKASITLMLAVVFFGGINLLALSIIGKYIQVIMEETKNRPVYIVDEKLNF